jgi:hypothetical protein
MLVRRRHPWQDFILSCFEKTGAIIRERNARLPSRLVKHLSFNQCIAAMREELYSPSDFQMKIMKCKTVDELKNLVKPFDHPDQETVLVRSNSVYRDYIGMAEDPQKFESMIKRSKNTCGVTHQEWLYHFVNNITDINSEFAKDVLLTNNISDLKEVLIAHPW